MITDQGLAGLAFADDGEEKAALADMTSRWPEADYVEDQQATTPYAERIFKPENWQPDQPLRVVFIGTDFEIRVWETLLRIPLGKRLDLFRHRRPSRQADGGTRGRHRRSGAIRCPSWCPATGCSENPAGLCGYHWGLTRKRAILGWEAGAMAA